MSARNDTTQRLPERPEGPLRLLALFGDQRRTFDLPASGTVTVGRGDSADFCVDDQAISRKHVSFHLGESLTVEDLGSANGTRVGGRSVAPRTPTALLPGELVEIGQTLLVVQRAHELGHQVRVDEHAYFESRLEDECGASGRAQRTFAVVRVRAPGWPPASAEARLAALTRPGDVLARYGPAEYELLWVDTEAKTIPGRLAPLRRELEELDPRAGVAAVAFPSDGRTAAQLLERLGAALRGVTETPVEANSMDGLRAIVGRVAASPLSVLITGETGVGKGVLAREIHLRSPRSRGPLVILNCAELSSSLLEAELFGFERGAFTGASSSKPGMVETADGGTLVLDEVAEMDLANQAKLLQVLGERQVRRLGSVRPRSVDVRVVAATNRDLPAEVERGAFRRDLYFRLAGMTLEIPPLRERRNEIGALARAFIAEFARSAGLAEVPTLSSAALEALARYSWPGNVRELRNAIERAVVLSDGEPIVPANLPVERRWAPVPPASGARPHGGDERARIEEALARCGGSQVRAAALLGISRRTLVTRLTDLGLPRPRKSRPAAD